MAAAYHFHLASNHPFVDGNKRAAVLAALVFLDANGVASLPDPNELERVTLAVAAGTTGKEELTAWWRNQLGQPPGDTP
jgi:death-on-curing protein